MIIGSGPNAMESTEWPRDWFDDMVAVNNAWRVRPDWSHLIYPEDFPFEKRPGSLGQQQQVVTAADYVPLQNELGGFVYAGGTMAFTAGYWALAELKPSILAFIGCDMVYPKTGPTHFYGTGDADPLRPDVTLQSLEAKAARLSLHAEARGCLCVNLSGDESRLVFPRAQAKGLSSLVSTVDPKRAQHSMKAPQEREDALGYFVASGRYWEEEDRFDPKKLAELDELWLAAFHGNER